MLDYTEIQQVLNFEEKGINRFLKKYRRAIRRECVRVRFDEKGTPYYFFDKEKEANLTNDLLLALKNFKGHK